MLNYLEYMNNSKPVGQCIGSDGVVYKVDFWELSLHANSILSEDILIVRGVLLSVNLEKSALDARRTDAGFVSLSLLSNPDPYATNAALTSFACPIS